MHVPMKAAFWILPLCGLACGNSGRIITTDTSESSSVSEMSLSSTLLIAVINGDLEQMTQLLDQGAEANDAIQVAVAGGNLDVVELLLDRGAVPDELTVLAGGRRDPPIRRKSSRSGQAAAPARGQGGLEIPVRCDSLRRS